MSYLAKIFVLGQERELLEADVLYRKLFDKRGLPWLRPLGGYLSVKLESQENDDVLLNWLTEVPKDELFTMQHGEVVFYNGSFDEPPMKRMRFFDAALVYYKEEFDARSNRPSTVTLTISAAIQDYGSLWIKPWQVSLPDEPEEPAPNEVQEEPQPEIVDCYYTDAYGNEDTELNIGDDVFLVLKTRGMVGETVDIDLSDFADNLSWKGDAIENGKIASFKIEGPTEKVKLRIVSPQPEPVDLQKG